MKWKINGKLMEGPMCECCWIYRIRSQFVCVLQNFPRVSEIEPQWNDRSIRLHLGCNEVQKRCIKGAIRNSE